MLLGNRTSRKMGIHLRKQFEMIRKYLTGLLFIPFFFVLRGYGQTAGVGLSRPKLVVGIVVDQMRWDYLYRYYNRATDRCNQHDGNLFDLGDQFVPDFHFYAFVKG